MLSAEVLLLVFVTFVIAGFIKGAIGFGLPVVAIVFLTIPLGLKIAIASMLIPGLVSNIWQALAGPELKYLTHRLWPYLLASVLGTLLGVSILSIATQDVLLTFLGLILTAYSIFSLFSPQIAPPGKKEKHLGPVAGGLGGLSYGITGVFLVPGVLYLQALGLKKDQLVQALGIVFVLLKLTLIAAFVERGFLSFEIALLSAFAVLPALLGVYAGQRVRRHISEQLFRTLFFVGLTFVGLYFVVVAQL